MSKKERLTKDMPENAYPIEASEVLQEIDWEAGR